MALTCRGRHAVDDLPQSALVDAGDVFVNRDDAVEMDRFGSCIVIVDDFDFWVIDDQTSALLFDFSVSNHLLARGDQFRHEWDVEPTARNFP